MTFKYILIVSLFAFFLYVLLAQRQVAIIKLFILGTISMMIVFSLFPDLSTGIANLLGIGRGADLLFYISHTTLFFVAFLFYLHARKMEKKWTKLIRHLSISEVKAPQDRE